MKSCTANFCRTRRLFRIEVRKKRPISSVSSANSLDRSLRAQTVILGRRLNVLWNDNTEGAHSMDRFYTVMMGLTLFWFIASNKDYLVSLLISLCILPLFLVLVKKSVKEIFLQVDKSNDKIVSSQFRKKKSRRVSMIQTTDQDSPSQSKKLKDLPPAASQRTINNKSQKKIPAPRKRKIRSSGTSSKYGNQENIIDAQMGDNTRNENAVEEIDKSRGKNKKNRNISPPPKTLAFSPFKVKYYTPLSLFINLDMPTYELYSRFCPYILDSNQLKENGYPLESAETPGKVDFGRGYRFLKSENSDERICCRCKEKFVVTKDGSYSSESTCCYHTGKRMPLGDIYNGGAFSCCGDPITSNGCQKSKQHVSAYGSFENVKFHKTRDKRNVSSSCIYALDCEMCYTVQGLEVTRVSIVGTDGLTVYDSYILPENPIIDYNTEFSGVTANHLKNVKTTLTDAQAYLMKLITSNTILVGHGLENDLKSLHIIHNKVVDTAVVYSNIEPHGKPRKQSLKTLSSKFLHRQIQQGHHGHDSVEDARTCIELMLMKIKKENQQPPPLPPPPQHNFIPVPTIPSQQWQQPPPPPLSINHVMVPYRVSYWVPPIGSSCDFF